MTAHAFLWADLPMPHAPHVEEAVREDDRLWFDAHPGETERVRAFAEGEAAVDPPPAGHRWVATVVRQLEPGVRTRQFVHVPKSDLAGNAR
jgi:hypothetical protein